VRAASSSRGAAHAFQSARCGTPHSSAKTSRPYDSGCRSPKGEGRRGEVAGQSGGQSGRQGDGLARRRVGSRLPVPWGHIQPPHPHPTPCDKHTQAPRRTFGRTDGWLPPQAVLRCAML
jgi:hypothetical protein